ncbi:hypothetical protein Tco_0709747 [Tanacetum coccineum]
MPVASVADNVMTAMFKQHQENPSSSFRKPVEESCVTCGGAHSYRQCHATDGNTFSGYQDNIQGYVSAYAVNYNQGNTEYRPQNVANQIRPPSFAQLNVQNNQTRLRLYQAPIHQPQVVTTSDFSNYIKANDAQHRLLPRGDLKAITTRSGISYDGPPIPPPSSSLPKVVEREPEILLQFVVSINRIDVIDVACEEYAQEVLGFSDSSTTLATNISIPPGIDDDNFNPEGDLLPLEKLLNDDPSSHLPPSELHVEELKIVKSSIDDPKELELK